MDEKITMTYQVEGGDLTHAGEASSAVKQSLRKLGLDTSVIRRVSVCMYEGEINMVIHANGGTAQVDVGLDDITITLTDRGPASPTLKRPCRRALPPPPTPCGIWASARAWACPI